MLMIVRGGVPELSASGIGLTFFGSDTVNSILHHDICSISHASGSELGTYRRLAQLSSLDLEPARAHDFALQDEQLERRRVRAKDVAKCCAAQVDRQFRLWLISITLTPSNPPLKP